MGESDLRILCIFPTKSGQGAGLGLRSHDTYNAREVRVRITYSEPTISDEAKDYPEDLFSIQFGSVILSRDDLQRLPVNLLREDVLRHHANDKQEMACPRG